MLIDFAGIERAAVYMCQKGPGCGWSVPCALNPAVWQSAYRAKRAASDLPAMSYMTGGAGRKIIIVWSWRDKYVLDLPVPDDACSAAAVHSVMARFHSSSWRRCGERMNGEMISCLLNAQCRH